MRRPWRNGYNRLRRDQATYRRYQLVQLLTTEGLGLAERGTQSRLAERLGVSRSVICRDVKQLLAAGRDAERCAFCGRPLNAEADVSCLGESAGREDTAQVDPVLAAVMAQGASG